MKLVKRIVAFALALLLLVIPAMGCRSYQQETKDSNTVAVIIDGEKYYMDEAKLYTYAAQYTLEDAYVFYILYYYGGYDEFWDADWSEALSEGIAELYQTKVLCNYAKANNITLTEEETAKIDDAIAEFKSDAGAAITYAGASDELVLKYFTENALANKVYCTIIEDVDTTFDEEEFRRKNVEGLTIIALDEAPDEDETEEDYVEEDTEEVVDEEEEYTGEPEEEETGVIDEEENADDTTAADDTTEATTEEAGGEGPVDDEETEAPLMVGAENEDAVVGVALDASDDSTDEVAVGAEADTEATEAETSEETTEEETTEEETTEAETYSEETKTEKREAALADVLARVEAGDELDDIVTDYRDDLYVTVTKISSSTYTPDDAAEADAEKTSYEQDAWELATGEVTSCTYDGEEEDSVVSYVLRCIDDDDADLRKEAEDEELAERKVNLFNEKYATILEGVKEFHVYDEKITSSIKYKGQIHDAMTIDGDDVEDFYETSSEEETEATSDGDQSEDDTEDSSDEASEGTAEDDTDSSTEEATEGSTEENTEATTAATE